MIRVREAIQQDVGDICEIFRSCYGADYPYAQFYDPQQLTKLVYSEDTLLLVAEDTTSGEIIGTASVILEIGAYSDLVGEFGRLAVHPRARQRGAGKLLMNRRLELVRDRLHMGLIEARVAHPYTLRIAESQGFQLVGFLPLKMIVSRRESVALLVQHFGNALELRRNHPRIIPEAYALANLALSNCNVPIDAVIDEQSAPYPYRDDFELEELSTDGYAALLRIERGRLRSREIFGPIRLHYGFFKIHARKSRYLISRDRGQVRGAIGFTVDEVERAVRIFELITPDDEAIRFLLGELERMCRQQWDIAYLEVDVSAFAPRMQRTLLEIGFLPAAYIPAMVFHEVERLDVVRMARLLTPLELGEVHLSSAAAEIARVVLSGFERKDVQPRIAEAVQSVDLFAGLELEQFQRLAGTCHLRVYVPGEYIFSQGQTATEMYVVLSGEVGIFVDGDSTPIGSVRLGECLGETALLSSTPYSATAVAQTNVEAAVLAEPELRRLIRQRPDIGLWIYRNLAVGLGDKLRRADRRM